MTVLRIEHLQRSFGSLVVTNDVSLTVEEGERHVIIGPNGAGKTSLINQIGGQLAPQSGRIRLGDLDITGMPPERIARAGIARTFQRNNLFPNLTVAENLRLAVQIKRGRPLDCFTPARRDRPVVAHAEALLSRVHLEGGGDRPVRNLSYGRAAAARDWHGAGRRARFSCCSMSRTSACRRPRPRAHDRADLDLAEDHRPPDD